MKCDNYDYETLNTKNTMNYKKNTQTTTGSIIDCLAAVKLMPNDVVFLVLLFPLSQRGKDDDDDVDEVMRMGNGDDENVLVFELIQAAFFAFFEWYEKLISTGRTWQMKTKRSFWNDFVFLFHVLEEAKEAEREREEEREKSK